jgi:hypothetical protein
MENLIEKVPSKTLPGIRVVVLEVFLLQKNLGRLKNQIDSFEKRKFGIKPTTYIQLHT